MRKINFGYKKLNFNNYNICSIIFPFNSLNKICFQIMLLQKAIIKAK